MSKKVNGLLNRIRKRTESEPISTSKGGEVNHWISTGSYGLNRICSGSIHRGIPSGKVVIFGGISQSGKSLMAAEVAANALNENDYDVVFYFDSEGGALKGFFESRGCDTDKIEHILLDSVEDATIQILNTYGEIVEFKKENPEFKALLIVDSIGALVPKKLLTDAQKGKQAQDMGLRAKLVNNLVKGCTIPALRADASIIFINHTYDDPAAMFTSKIQTQGGGKGLQYQASLVIQTSKKLEKTEDTKTEGYYDANVLRFFTTKNRFVQPFKETEVRMDFVKGADKYGGIFPVAIQYGFIKQSGAYYTVPSYSDKKLRKNAILTGPECDAIWDSFIDQFDEMSGTDLAYGSKLTKDIDGNELRDIDEIEKESNDQTPSDLKTALSESML